MTRVSGVHTRVSGLAAVALSAAFFTAPAWAADYTPGAIDKSLAGATINLLVPPWAAYKQALLDDFTARTGITVKVESVDFNSIHDKIVTAAASGQAVADVIELDWTWVSQFGAAGWLTPLDKLLTPQQVQDAVGCEFLQLQWPAGRAAIQPRFPRVAGQHEQVQEGRHQRSADDLGSNCSRMPRTLKVAGVAEFPIAMPLSITENTSTPWYTLVRAAGGIGHRRKGPAGVRHNGVGVSSLQFIHDAYAAGRDRSRCDRPDAGARWIKNSSGATPRCCCPRGPASVNLGHPGAEGSNIVGDELRFIHVPGEKNNTGGTIALEEALAIPSALQESAGRGDVYQLGIRTQDADRRVQTTRARCRPTRTR